MKSRTLAISAALAALPSIGLASGDLFNGSITWSTPTDPIIATEQWASFTTKLTWSISYDATSTHPWVYTYDWSTTEKGLSHIILEVSQQSTRTEFLGLGTGDQGPRTWSQSDPGNSNPGLPGDIFGIKFDGGGVTSKTLVFNSTHAPTWGDFYAQDGVNRRGNNSYDVYAYNAGFLQADPLIDFIQIGKGILTTLKHTGPRANHISVPDTLNLRPPDFGPVPEATAGWGFAGLIGVAVYRVHRKRASQSPAT